jgi:hypothetical protein
VISGLRRGAGVLAVGPGARDARATDRRRKAPRGGRPPSATTIRFNLSEPAAVRVAVERARRGRRTAPGKQCRPRPRRGRRCIVWKQKRLLTHDGAAGANAIRLRARGLPQGRYRLVLTAQDGVGNMSAERRLGLRVVWLRSARRASDRP